MAIAALAAYAALESATSAGASERWPTRASTGPPTAAKLERVGDVTITRPGTVIDRRDIRGCVTIETDHVTIRRSRIRCRSWYPVRFSDAARKVRIVDVEISCGGFPATGLNGHHVEVVATHIHSCADGLRLGDRMRVTDSLVDGLIQTGDSHNDAAQSTGARHVVLRHNTLLNRFDQTSAIILGEEQAPTSEVLIADNLLAGGGYTVYCGSPEARGVRVVRNHFSTRFFRTIGRWGAHTDCGGVAAWRGNVIHETGRPLRPNALTSGPVIGRASARTR